MTLQFRKNPLLQALLGLISLSTTHLAYAQDNNDDIQTLISTPTISSANDAKAQAFFQQYYLSAQQIAEQNLQDRVKDNALCSGAWITPISANNTTPSESTAVLAADQAYYNPQGTSYLEGNVTIEQEGRTIRADRIELDPTQTYAKIDGKVQLAQGGLFAQSDTVNYNLKTQTGDLNNSYYISEQQQAHGFAEKINRPAQDIVVLNNASYSTCAPGQRPAWHIQAQSIELNDTTGRGVTKDARLYIKGTPILPIPYFNFPIDDRRTTGFLTPIFGYTNDGGMQLGTPYYLNLAPNYDFTLTPRFFTNKGLMFDGDFNYLTKNFGQGEIRGGYLYQDDSFNDQDRKSLHWEHHWKINSQWQTAVDLNYVSDKDYFTDLGTSPTTQDQVYQERTWMLNYANGIPGVTAQLRVQDFQTLDPTIKDVDRPYARLPQFLFSYEGGKYDGLEYSFDNDTAYFKKSITDSSSLETSGTRIYNQASARYNFRTPSAFITPEISLRSINTFFDEDTKLSQGFDVNRSVEKSVALPQFTLDSGLVFERNGEYLQTLSPRLFYAYSPYQEQNDYPNFDSASASISYDQLFSPYRFYGHDRLEDNHFTSLGLTYRLYDEVGLERLRASVGQSFYFADRRVKLNEADPVATNDTSGPVLTVSSQLSNTIHVTGNSAWLSNGTNALNNISANYADDQGRLYNLGYFYRRPVKNQNQQAYQQLAASFIQPINDSWSILGHAQYDFNNEVTREWLVGLNYESCCWGVSVYGRSYYNDLDDPSSPDTSAKKAFMAEFTLKGLGGLSGKLASLLKGRVTGFDHVN